MIMMSVYTMMWFAEDSMHGRLEVTASRKRLT